MPGEELDRHVYQHRDEAAVEHLFLVAASLDSMIVGGAQILGQLKEAYRHAAKSGCTGFLLNKLMHKAFSVAKRVRTETRIGASAVSISYAAVELARKIFGDLKDKRVLLIGAGRWPNWRPSTWSARAWPRWSWPTAPWSGRSTWPAATTAEPWAWRRSSGRCSGWTSSSVPPARPT